MTDDPRVSVGPEGRAMDSSEIGAAMLKRLEMLQASLASEDLQTALVRAFGILVTQPREDELRPDDEAPATRATVPGGAAQSVVLLERARTAYVSTPTGADLFVDGEVIATTLEFAQEVCARSVGNKPVPAK